MIDNLGEMHWVARRVHPILPCMKLYWDGFGLSYICIFIYLYIYEQIEVNMKCCSSHTDSTVISVAGRHQLALRDHRGTWRI